LANPQKIKAEVKEIISYGRQVYKLVFKTEKKMPRFKAGQFLHLTLDNFDPTTGFWPESKVFSIASCSDDRKEVSIVFLILGLVEYVTFSSVVVIIQLKQILFEKICLVLDSIGSGEPHEKRC